MIDEGIQNGVYIVTEDRTLEDLILFRSFLYCNLTKYEHYEKMLPTSNQSRKVVEPTKPQFYKRSVDDIINKP